jgi:HD-GYP domain-containing protein (c-di-GMP phosphodiesterase class II)
LESKILAVADIVEAMASHRPYRAALGIDAALTEITRQRGFSLDEQVVDTCLRVFQVHGYIIED